MAERSDLDVEYFAPTTPHGESRSETLARVIHDEHLEDTPGRVGADPTTASGRPAGIAIRAGVAFVVGAVVGAVIGLALYLIAPGPFDVDSIGDALGYIAIIAGAFAMIFTLVATLMMFEREDGRTEDAVEEEIGYTPPPPAG